MSDETGGRHLTCGICSSLSDYESALQHVQGEEDDTVLPEAVGKLGFVRDFRPEHPRLSLQQCPECKTYYMYASAYEFLIGFGGSYDEQILRRLSDEVGSDLREGRRFELLITMEP
jgi:hypothetical protein